MTAPGDSRYLFEHAEDAELGRLRAIEAVCDPWTVDVLKRTGPFAPTPAPAGWRCLDIGGAPAQSPAG